MKNIVIITALLSVLAAGIVGLLFIFEVMAADRAIAVLGKTIAAFVVVGACAAAISALMPGKKD